MNSLPVPFGCVNCGKAHPSLLPVGKNWLKDHRFCPDCTERFAAEAAARRRAAREHDLTLGLLNCRLSCQTGCETHRVSSAGRVSAPVPRKEPCRVP